MSSGRFQSPLFCWDCGFESHLGHACLFLVSVVCCQVEVSASGYHLSRGVLPSVVCESHRGASVIGRPWPTRGCCPMGRERYVVQEVPPMMDWIGRNGEVRVASRGQEIVSVASQGDRFKCISCVPRLERNCISCVPSCQSQTWGVASRD